MVPILMLCSVNINAAQTENVDGNLIQAYQLRYIEREPGIEDYPITITVSDTKLRLDEAGEGSGYIIYDDVKKVIYSVSNHDESILRIDEHKFSSDKSPAKSEVEYKQLEGAPSVDGKSVFSYRVYTTEGGVEKTCTEVHLAEQLLPEVQEMLRNYQLLISGQQVKMTDNKVTPEQTACYFADQIYNTGSYYKKGMPIYEWHSNERSKMLQSFKKVTVDRELFVIPETYHQFSIDKNSKTFIN